ncbi:MAG TPA: uroporphyrinogen-III synthase [Acidimicrobiales bacterium]|nr:uroporphyrinogen-III synthase [Acidimicrobiales bacterium]
MEGDACCGRTSPLTGFTVGITADRRCEEQRELIEHRGGRTIHAPTVRTAALADEAPLHEATDRLIDDPPDILVATTGIGMRGWMTATRASGREQHLLAALRQARIVARGPKVHGALHEAQLPIWRDEPSEQLAPIIARLAAEEPPGTHVAVQLYGADAAWIVDELRAANLDVTTVPVYSRTVPADTGPSVRLVQLVVDAAVDAVTFTSVAAAENFFEVAASVRLADRTRRAFNTNVVACCVGPFVAATVRDQGVLDPCAPSQGRLGLMVYELGVRLGARHRHVQLPGVDVAVQGSTLATDDRRVELAGRERAVFELLADRPGTVVPVSTLLRRVWGKRDGDAGVMEKAASRLRRQIHPVGLDVLNVMRRGYALSPALTRRRPPVRGEGPSIGGEACGTPASR